MYVLELIGVRVHAAVGVCASVGWCGCADELSVEQRIFFYIILADLTSADVKKYES